MSRRETYGVCGVADEKDLAPVPARDGGEDVQRPDSHVGCFAGFVSLDMTLSCWGFT